MTSGIVSYFDSPYRFTNPIRYFKANDPYFYEVDNIPIKQQEENSKFLKDQVEGLLGKTANLQVDRSGFTELRPSVDEFSARVIVQPGQFTARINDAYAINPLQFITQALGVESNLEPNEWGSQTNVGPLVSGTIAKFRSTLTADALNMNGLAERAFTFPMRSNDLPSEYVTSSYPGYAVNIGAAATRPTYPNFIGQIWTHGTPFPTRKFPQAESLSLGSFYHTGKLESEFIKRWRGVARTAIVDVPSALSMEIPSFDEDEHFYYDETGTKILTDATQRIDLLFIYSKAIDQQSTTIPAFAGVAPTTITEPTLGIVKGAGIGVSFQTGVTQSNSQDVVSLQTQGGTPLMLSHAADENGTAGFSTVKGSFPSPDDLMNLAPLLSENVEQENFSLIGQSILPIAYIVVKKSASLTETGASIIAAADVIDIRPFFRTTELAYNERGGIAAATPQISLANPVASEGYVDTTVKDLQSNFNSKIGTIYTTLATDARPRVIGSGYVKGGFNYGVESVLGHYIAVKQGTTNAETAKQQVISRYGYPAGTVIPDRPDWDIAEWLKRGTGLQKGEYPNDHINYHAYGPGFANNANPSVEFAAFSRFGAASEFASRARIASLGTDQIRNTGQSASTKGNVMMHFVKKRIFLDRSQVQWASDYHVDAQLWNCAPLSCRTHKDGNNLTVAGNASVWIDKKPNEFTIFVSWVANDQYNAEISGGSTEPGTSTPYPFQNRDAGEMFAGFSVINHDILEHSYVNGVVEGESSAGVAIYPTVSFQIIGIPNGFSANAINLNGTNPSINLM